MSEKSEKRLTHSKLLLDLTNSLQSNRLFEEQNIQLPQDQDHFTLRNNESIPIF